MTQSLAAFATHLGSCAREAAGGGSPPASFFIGRQEDFFSIFKLEEGHLVKGEKTHERQHIAAAYCSHRLPTPVNRKIGLFDTNDSARDCRECSRRLDEGRSPASCPIGRFPIEEVTI